MILKKINHQKTTVTTHKQFISKQLLLMRKLTISLVAIWLDASYDNWVIPLALNTHQIDEMNWIYVCTVGIAAH